MDNRPTVAADFAFEPKVWSDHAMAYFDKKLVYGAFAVKNSELEAEGTGLVVNFPYYNTIGPAKKVREDESVETDNLTDDSFTATIFEVAKGASIKKKAFKKSADSSANIMANMQAQIGRRHAEFVDQELNDEITKFNGVAGGDIEVPTTRKKFDNMVIGFQPGLSGVSETGMNIRTLTIAKTRAFGDKSEDAVVCYMHPLQWLDSRIDEKSGFLKADANEPFSAINGFVGRFGNMAIITVESVKKLAAQISGKDAYLAHMHKANSYGIINKQDMEFDYDKDIKAREWEVVGNQWYGVTSFHAKISPDDTKSAGIITTVDHDLV